MSGETPENSTSFPRLSDMKRGPRILLITFSILMAITLLGLTLGAPTDDGPAFADVLYQMGLAGIVGFGTNWIAIRMLFHPYQKIAGVQGVIPRKRAELSRRAAELMEERLISSDRLIEYLRRQGAIEKITEALGSKLSEGFDDPSFNEKALDIAADALCSASGAIVGRLQQQIEEKVNEMAGPFAGLAMGMVGKLGESVQAKMSEHAYVRAMLEESGVNLGDAAKKLLAPDGEGAGAMVERALEALMANLKVADLIEEELAKQSIEEFEQMVDDAANSELVFLQVAGGILGALAGLAMIWPWLLMVYGGGFAVAMLAPRFKAKPKLITYEPSGRQNSVS